MTDKAARSYSRVFFASAFDDIPDKQGRVTVPSALRTYAGLTKDCVVIGANTRLEIWDAAAWATLRAGAGSGLRRPGRGGAAWRLLNRSLPGARPPPAPHLTHLPRCQAAEREGTRRQRRRV